MAFAPLSTNNLRWYFLPLLLCWVCFAIFIAAIGKDNAFFTFHPQQANEADSFMRTLTHLGDGLFLVAVVLLFLSKRHWLNATYILLVYAISGLGAQIIKHILMMPRPLAYFEQKGVALYTIPGLVVHASNSFPSGHATTAFALSTCLAIIYRPKFLAIPLLALASLVAITRVYLGQHFTEDVLAGSILGVGSALVGRYLVLMLRRRFPVLRNGRLHTANF